MIKFKPKDNDCVSGSRTLSNNARVFGCEFRCCNLITSTKDECFKYHGKKWKSIIKQPNPLYKLLFTSLPTRSHKNGISSYHCC